MTKLNLYGDSQEFLAGGHGADIASQRADDLDLMAVNHVAQRASLSLKTFAIDIACGAGGQAIRLAVNGAQVLALDIMDMKSHILQGMERHPESPERVVFEQFDMRRLEHLRPHPPADVIICQRAIHYLPYAQAVTAVQQMARLLTPDGRLFISASGLNSELGEGYGARETPLTDRYTGLEPLMRDKHGICGPVCLYTQDDLSQLLIDGGLEARSLFTSPFGNIKAVAGNVQK